MSSHAVNTKYKYHISWNLAVPFTVTLILRTYPRPINVKGSDKHQPPGQAGSVRCRGLPPQLRFATLPRSSLLLDGKDLEGISIHVLDSWIQVPASTFQLPCSGLLDSSFLASTYQHPCSTLPHLLPLPWKPRKSTVSNNTAFTAYRCLDCLHL